ncbi:MAG TPA: helix-turn-helix domain-containing protein [Solirubrobacterales bacterium]|nr:helix-turn-helix domain-containing protein [Solirubrobacterales bacterium]
MTPKSLQRASAASVRSLDEACSALASRLRGRLPELEASIATRMYAIADPRQVADPTYLHSLHGALTAALEHALDLIEHGERRTPGVPPALLAEARLAARAGVALDTVLRRYCAGNALLGDLLVAEAEHAEVSSSALRRLLRRQAMLFDRLLEAVSEEHVREAKSWPSSTTERRRECVKSLLAGEQVDHSELGYDLDAHHLALMAKGEASPEAMRVLAARLDRRLLAVCREEEPIWACWLGGGRPLGTEQALRALGEIPLDRVFVTVGEPGEGLSGWRLSHRQAKAALPIAERRGQAIVRYADVALLASILRDDLVATSLHQLYLEPLERARDGGGVARETLRAYFAAERNISSTAAALGVDRRTVTNRMRAIEDLFGRPVKDFATELETALRLDD